MKCEIENCQATLRSREDRVRHVKLVHNGRGMVRRVVEFGSVIHQTNLQGVSRSIVKVKLDCGHVVIRLSSWNRRSAVCLKCERLQYDPMLEASPEFEFALRMDREFK